MRKSFRWLEKAIAYLDELKPAIDRRFDLGHGLVFQSPRLGRAYIGQHERRIVGFPVLDEINIYYEVVAAKPLTIEAGFGDAERAEKALDEAGLQFTSKRIEDRGGAAQKTVISVPASIPSSVSFHADYQTGLVRVTVANVDRFDRAILEFHSASIDETVLEDLVRFMLGRSDAFLHRAPLAGIHGQPPV